VVVGLAVTLAVSGCQGDTARYIGRVGSVTGDRLCLGPNTSGPNGTCGTIPPRTAPLPAVGVCVSLTANYANGGTKLSWHRSDLEATYKGSCR
jgi:hypothetical protein